ncbi:MAG TPA: TMEM165/GDT1 family protein [Planctomycetota bacterium]
MDWKLFFGTFGAVFLAELGDKTQLATMALAGESRKPWVVFAAASLALIAAAGLGAAAGGLLAKWVPEAWVRRGAALLFIGAGVWLLLRK